MARNIRRVTASSGVAVPPKIRTEGGKLTDTALAVINSVFAAFALKLNGRISFGDGAQSAWTGNVDGEIREFTTPGVADTEFTVDHGLKRVPIGFLVINCDKAGTLYASRPYGWNKDAIYMKHSATSALMKIVLI